MSSIHSSSSLIFIHQLNANTQNTMSVLERLATGNAINRASDDPSGLMASEEYASRLNVIQSQITSYQRSESVLNIQDGALGASLSNIADLDSLVIQGANSGAMSSDELGALQTQVSGVLLGIDRLSSASGIDVLSNVSAEMVVGTDEVTGDPIYETVSLSDLSRVMEIDPQAAQELVDGARSAVVQAQAEVGIEARANESQRRVLEEEQINLARAYSQTRDADYAKESSALIRSQILEQASVYTILAARESSEMVLGLIDIRA